MNDVKVDVDFQDLAQCFLQIRLKHEQCPLTDCRGKGPKFIFETVFSKDIKKINEKYWLAIGLTSGKLSLQLSGMTATKMAPEPKFDQEVDIQVTIEQNSSIGLDKGIPNWNQEEKQQKEHFDREFQVSSHYNDRQTPCWFFRKYDGGILNGLPSEEISVETERTNKQGDIRCRCQYKFEVVESDWVANIQIPKSISKRKHIFIKMRWYLSKIKIIEECGAKPGVISKGSWQCVVQQLNS